MDNFKHEEICKIIYSAPGIIDNGVGLEYTYKCPHCQNELWEVRKRFGKKVNKGAIKFRCTNCGQWFIASESLVVKVPVNTNEL